MWELFGRNPTSKERCCRGLRLFLEHHSITGSDLWRYLEESNPLGSGSVDDDDDDAHHHQDHQCGDEEGIRETRAFLRPLPKYDVSEADRGSLIKLCMLALIRWSGWWRRIISFFRGSRKLDRWA